MLLKIIILLYNVLVFMVSYLILAQSCEDACESYTLKINVDIDKTCRALTRIISSAI